MAKRFILASGSEIRATLMRNAGIEIEVAPARVDEDAIRQSLDADAAKPRDVADTLAEYKARRVANANPDALVLGVESHEVVHIQPCAADGWFSFYPGVRAMPIVVVQPVR